MSELSQHFDRTHLGKRGRWAGCPPILFMALGNNQVTYSDRKFCQSVCLSVCPGFATSGTSRQARTMKLPGFATSGTSRQARTMKLGQILMKFDI